MEIVFDDYKRDLTLAMRRLDFADLTMDFFERASIVPAKVSRFKAVGEFGGKIITVIFEPLGFEALSVIPMRRANQNERNDYESFTS